MDIRTLQCACTMFPPVLSRLIAEYARDMDDYFLWLVIGRQVVLECEDGVRLSVIEIHEQGHHGSDFHRIPWRGDVNYANSDLLIEISPANDANEISAFWRVMSFPRFLQLVKSSGFAPGDFEYEVYREYELQAFNSFFRFALSTLRIAIEG
jgi:hypothetical protein